MNGLKRMKEANKYAECLLAGYPDTADAYIALGIANYIIGSQSAGSRFALWFDGIHGNKKLGMEQVANTAENGRYLRPFAKIILALAARREKQAALAQSCCTNCAISIRIVNSMLRSMPKHRACPCRWPWLTDFYLRLWSSIRL
jgi:hypothetical protein